MTQSSLARLISDLSEWIGDHLDMARDSLMLTADAERAWARLPPTDLWTGGVGRARGRRVREDAGRKDRDALRQSALHHLKLEE